MIGGEAARDGALAKGSFFQPTIFAEVKPDARIALEEIFGPVTSVIAGRLVGGDRADRELRQVRPFDLALHARHQPRVPEHPRLRLRAGVREPRHHRRRGAPPVRRHQGDRQRPPRGGAGRARLLQRVEERLHRLFAGSCSGRRSTWSSSTRSRSSRRRERNVLPFAIGCGNPTAGCRPAAEARIMSPTDHVNCQLLGLVSPSSEHRTDGQLGTRRPLARTRSPYRHRRVGAVSQEQQAVRRSSSDAAADFMARAAGRTGSAQRRGGTRRLGAGSGRDLWLPGRAPTRFAGQPRSTRDFAAPSRDLGVEHAGEIRTSATEASPQTASRDPSAAGATARRSMLPRSPCRAAGDLRGNPITDCGRADQ